VIDEWGNYACVHVTMWVISKLENKIVSTLIWRRVGLVNANYVQPILGISLLLIALLIP